MSRLSWLAAVLAVCCSAGCASSAPVPLLTIGEQVDFNLLEDQHGKPFTHQAAMKLVLYVDSMKAKNLVRDTLVAIDTGCLHDGRVVYLADISGMPGLISTLIAVPRMRNYPYPIWLDRSGVATDALPVQDDAVTLLTVEQQAITRIEFLAGATALLPRLQAECGPAAQQVAVRSGG